MDGFVPFDPDGPSQAAWAGKDGEVTGVDVEGLLEQLTLDEKALLTAGQDMWSIPAVERLGVPEIRVTDGPNGASGHIVVLRPPL